MNVCPSMSNRNNNVTWTGILTRYYQIEMRKQVRLQNQFYLQQNSDGRVENDDSDNVETSITVVRDMNRIIVHRYVIHTPIIYNNIHTTYMYRTYNTDT